jgi:hypothetical protein
MPNVSGWITRENELGGFTHMPCRQPGAGTDEVRER